MMVSLWLAKVWNNSDDDDDDCALMMISLWCARVWNNAEHIYQESARDILYPPRPQNQSKQNIWDILGYIQYI